MAGLEKICVFLHMYYRQIDRKWRKPAHGLGTVHEQPWTAGRVTCFRWGRCWWSCHSTCCPPRYNPFSKNNNMMAVGGLEKFLKRNKRARRRRCHTCARSRPQRHSWIFFPLGLPSNWTFREEFQHPTRRIFAGNSKQKSCAQILCPVSFVIRPDFSFEFYFSITGYNSMVCDVISTENLLIL